MTDTCREGPICLRVPSMPRPWTNNPCAVEGCAKRASSLGWCKSHYDAWRRYGDPTGHFPTREERFWAKVALADVPSYAPHLGPCSEWMATLTPSGYGQVQWDGRLTATHRIAYELTVGPIPDGLELDHLCRNTRCLKAWVDDNGPGHLEPVTHKENMLRGIRATATHCKRGHSFSGTNLQIYRGHRLCKACQKLHNDARYR